MRFLQLVDYGLVVLVRFVKAEPGRCVLLWRDIQIRHFASPVLRMQMPQERHAPLAARPRAQTLTDERRHRRIFNRQERPNLSEADSEAQADFIIRVHG